MKALICDGAYFLPRLSTQASPLSPGMILYGTRSMSRVTIGSFMRRPISRLIAKKVFSGLVTAWRFAAWPTRRSPDSVNATIDGVVRATSAFSMTLALEPSITATQELVVPRSMPITLLMGTSSEKQDRSARESTVPIPREHCRRDRNPPGGRAGYICGGAGRYNRSRSVARIRFAPMRMRVAGRCRLATALVLPGFYVDWFLPRRQSVRRRPVHRL